jgi:hypothetical protein
VKTTRDNGLSYQPGAVPTLFSGEGAKYPTCAGNVCDHQRELVVARMRSTTSRSAISTSRNVLLSLETHSSNAEH